VFRRVGCGLSRVPLEHLFNIYEIAHADGGPGIRSLRLQHTPKKNVETQGRRKVS